MPSPTLTWPGRGDIPLRDGDRYLLVPAGDPAAAVTGTLTVTGTVGHPAGGNLVVTGEARDALGAVAADPTFGPAWTAGARLAYLDPPFGTGRRFSTYDDNLDPALWLSLFETRLAATLPLLADDATIWVHLDEAHVHHARCILDDVLGPDTYLRTVVWQRKNKPGPSRSIAATCDYLLVHGRTKGVRLHRHPPTPAQLARYTNPDNDPAGPWMRRHDGTRRYRSEFVAAGTVPTSLWPRDDVGDNEEGTRELVALFGTKVFDTPKPERLLHRIVTVATRPGDRVVDPYAGSGTTAAVALKTGRRFLLSELRPGTVADIIVPRLTKVVDGTDPGGITATTGWTGGSGFAVTTVT